MFNVGRIVARTDQSPDCLQTKPTSRSAVLLKWDKNSPFFAQKEDSGRRRVGGYQASYLSPNNQLLSIRMVTSSLALSHPNDHHVGMDM